MWTIPTVPINYNSVCPLPVEIGSLYIPTKQAWQPHPSASGVQWLFEFRPSKAGLFQIRELISDMNNQQWVRINQYSTLTARVWKTSWKNGMNINNTNIETVNPMAMNIYRFLVDFGPIGGCWTMDNRLVRVMSKFPYCINTKVTKYTDCARYKVF